METGKLSPELLNKYIFEPLRGLPGRPEVILRPGPGEDCAALELPGQILVSADPITAASQDTGYLAVHINANDIAASGGEPVGIMLTVLLPTAADESDLRDIMDGVCRAAAEIGVEVLGGHTEVTDAVTRPVVSAAIIGKTRRFVPTSGARPGDMLVMTKYAGLEGTVIIARERAERIRALGRDVYERALGRAAQLSVIKEAGIAAAMGASAMHDITEGGVLGACYEMAESSETGVVLELDSVPVLDETRRICREFGIDPYMLVSSGCLLIAIRDGEALVERLSENGVPARVIGRMTGEGKFYRRGNALCTLPEPQSDEIYKI